MTDKSIIIIGAGITGLSAGCYGQMNGYKTEIFELHNLPGGLCTAWKRKGYTFDGCIHWLVGSGEGTSFNKLWMEIGALQDKEIINHDEFIRIQGKDGKTLILYNDLDRLEQHLKELAPVDTKTIEELIRDIRIMAKVETPAGAPANFKEALPLVIHFPAMMRLLNVMQRHNATTIGEYLQRFKDPFLREALSKVFNMPEFSMSGLSMTLAWMSRKDAGYPIGGSLPFARSIEKRYLDLGGKIHYNARVEKVLVENDKAVGVRLEDGTEHRADIVISAADGHATIFDMLEGKYVDEEIKGYYENMLIFQPVIQVSLGVNRDFSDQPHHVVYELDEPVMIAGKERETIALQHHSYDPTLAPEGKSYLSVLMESNYAYWQQLRDEDNERYEAEKKQTGLTVIAELEKRFPGFEGDVEVTDVATPLTFERYTGNWQGSFEGWMVTPETSKYMGASDNEMRRTLPGLENFYMIGQWVMPGGGLPTGVMLGRDMIMRLCKQDKRRFVTITP